MLKEEGDTMSKYWRTLIFLGVVVLLSMLTASGSLAQEPQEPPDGLYENVFGGAKQSLEMDELPVPIQLAARTAISDIKITDVATEITSDGQFIYVVNFEDPAAGKGSMDITPEGRILQAEAILATAEQLPPLLGTRMKTWIPDLEVTQVEKSVRPDGIVYELDGTDAEGNAIYVEMPANGRSIMMRVQED